MCKRVLPTYASVVAAALAAVMFLAARGVAVEAQTPVATGSSLRG